MTADSPAMSASPTARIGIPGPGIAEKKIPPASGRSRQGSNAQRTSAAPLASGFAPVALLETPSRQGVDETVPALGVQHGHRLRNPRAQTVSRFNVTASSWFPRHPNPMNSARQHDPRALLSASHERSRTAACAREGRPAVPARRHLGRQGGQLRPVLGPRDQGRGLPLRSRGKRDRAHRAARVPRRDLPRLRARHRGRNVLRLPRARSLRARRRPPLQPEQAGARSLRARAFRRAEMGSRRLRLQGRRSAGRSRVRRARQRAVHAEVRGGRPGLQLEAREGLAPGAVGNHDHLRDARARVHQAASQGAGEPARHLRRPRDEGSHRVRQVARRHLGRAAAGAHLHQR